MVYPFTSGVSVNVNTRCLVKEKPKDRERLNEVRKAATKHVGLGIRIPFTDYEGVPTEEAQLQANEPRPKPGRFPTHQRSRRVAQMEPDVESQLPPSRQSRRSSISRHMRGHESQGSFHAPSIREPEDIANERPSHRQSSNQGRYPSPQGSRHSRRESQDPNQQTRVSRDAADIARNSFAKTTKSTKHRSSAAQMSVDQGGNHRQKQSKSHVNSRRSRQTTRELDSYQRQGRSGPSGVQIDDESR